MCNRRERTHSSRFAALRIAVIASLIASSAGCTGYMDAEPTLSETIPDENLVQEPAPSQGSGTGSGTDAAAPLPITQDQLSNEAITRLLAEKRYRGAGYRKVNATPFPSTVSPEKTITIWISESAFDAYAQVAPDQAGSRAVLPVGSVIVREVLKDSVLDAITVMLRLPNGAFPLGGDWWYCSATPDGVIKQDATSGTPVIGLLENCGTCHLRRRDDDHLFGVPRGYVTRR